MYRNTVQRIRGPGGVLVEEWAKCLGGWYRLYRLQYTTGTTYCPEYIPKHFIHPSTNTYPEPLILGAVFVHILYYILTLQYHF